MLESRKSLDSASEMELNLEIEKYLSQMERWPGSGRHILAHFDDDTVVVYQAYRPEIGRFALDHGFLGGEHFSLTRMSWVKTNFLWMMHRSGWGSKPGQEMVLAIRLRRAAFDCILAQAVPSVFYPAAGFRDQEAWQAAVASSQVRLQWDPDHDPMGGKLSRRAIQLGLRGDVLRSFASSWIVQIQDVSALAREQATLAAVRDTWSSLVTPREQVYPVPDAAVSLSLGISSHEGTSADPPESSNLMESSHSQSISPSSTSQFHGVTPSENPS